jgi:hypothetical protein
LINLLSSVVSAHLGSSSSLGVFEQHEDRRLGQGCAFAWPGVIYRRSGAPPVAPSRPRSPSRCILEPDHPARSAAAPRLRRARKGVSVSGARIISFE